MKQHDLKLISVDPGTINCGIALWTLNGRNLKINNLETLTLVIDTDLTVEMRIWLLYRNIRELISFFRPLHLIHEGAFMNRFRPLAYGPIYATINIIRKAFYDWSGSIDRIFVYPPKLVKSTIITGKANKNMMQIGINRIGELKPFLNSNMNEHEIDAIGIGYTHILNLRSIPELMLL